MKFGFKKCLAKARIRNFEPHTDTDNPIERKMALKANIREQIDVEKVTKDCEGKLFSLNVIYYLNRNTTILGRYKKDLDNMTKIVCDVLTDYLSEQDKVSNQKTGLGLMHDDVDIHELHLVKKFVDEDSDQGLDIILYKWSDKKHDQEP